jgi:cytochrome c peroxidase
MKIQALAVALAIFLGPLGAAEPIGREPLQPIPLQILAEAEKAALGHKLFFEPRLSKTNLISCASCHDLASGGADKLAVSTGINGSKGEINSPTVFNSGLNFRQFWNGRAKSLEDQIDGPISHPKELGSNWPEVIAKISADPAYSSAFAKAFSDGITAANIKSALAAFERSLATPNAPFDRYLRGDPAAISEQEKLGYAKFKAYGCVACHQGVNVGGNMFQTMGVMGDYFKDRGTPVTEADLGKFVVTKNPQDKHVFRVPSLRNVALTAPYFHDGSAHTLNQAVKIMAKYQLGRPLPKEDLEAIVAFLKTLTGETPAIIRGPAGK